MPPYSWMSFPVFSLTAYQRHQPQVVIPTRTNGVLIKDGRPSANMVTHRYSDRLIVD